MHIYISNMYMCNQDYMYKHIGRMYITTSSVHVLKTGSEVWLCFWKLRSLWLYIVLQGYRRNLVRDLNITGLGKSGLSFTYS